MPAHTASPPRPWRLRAALLATLALAAGPAAWAQSLRPARLVLPNGLRVIALEDHTVPSIALHIVFKVGSRNERTGRTGMAHLFEHMMFNGSARYAPGEFDRVIEGRGGYSNAETSADTTAYYEEFTSGALDEVLRMEADRLRSLRIDGRNLEQERGIVLEERRASYDNSVDGALYETLWNNAFVAHPYQWLPIGFARDIQAIRLEDARSFFRTHYTPNNAVMAVVGDFRTPDLFARVRRHFGTLPRGPAAPGVVRSEPTQQGERRITLRRAAELPAVLIGYHVGTIKDSADPALDVLAAVLSTGESSRLHRALVYEQRVATYAGAYNESRLDPGLFTLGVQAQPGRTAAECEAALYAVLEDVKAEGVTDTDLTRARRALRVAWVDMLKTNAGRARLLAGFEADWGDWKRMETHLAARERVTSDQVRAAAMRFLVPDRRTVVTLEPLPSGPQEAAR